MQTPSQQEELVRDIVRSTHESIDLVELGSRVFPKIDRLFDSSTSLLYQSNQKHEIVPISGDLSAAVPYYSQYYFDSDPLQKTAIRTNPKVLLGSTMNNWEEYLASAAFNEYTTKLGMDYFLFMRVSQCRIYDPGMVGIMLGRTFRQEDFSDHDLSMVKKILPALEALARRHDRLEKRVRVHSYVETLMELAHGATIILDLNGAYIWASERAAALLPIDRNSFKRVPKELELGAKRLGAFLERNTNASPPPMVLSVSRDNEEAIVAEMRLARNRNGNYFVVIDLPDSGVSPQVAVVAASYQLSKAETDVLQLISRGFNDQEIGNHLFISYATVRSHVTRILSKLGVKSRTQAALLAHGHKVTDLD